VLVQVAELLLVALEVHAQEGRKLHEAGVHAPHLARVRRRHVADEVLLEPVDRLAGGQLVHAGGIDAAIDRAGHQRQAARRGGVVVLGHQGGGGQRGHAGLADRDHVRAGADGVEELHHVVDVVVQPEGPVPQRTSRALCQSVM
jgi:hypothetical protein